MGGGGVKNNQVLRDVINGRPLIRNLNEVNYIKVLDYWQVFRITNNARWCITKY